MKYRLSHQADRDIEDIWAFIARKSIRQANSFLDTLCSKFASLAKHPLMGTPCLEIAPNLRLIVVKNHVVFYRQFENGIEVVRILHGARNIESLFHS